jgi:hypothetical protein
MVNALLVVQGASTFAPKRNWHSYDPFLYVTANTLGEALAQYCMHERVLIEPYDGSFTDLPFVDGVQKYFIHTQLDHGQQSLVDIHITRADESICPKQDLGFAIQPGDEIYVGILIC